MRNVLSAILRFSAEWSQKQSARHTELAEVAWPKPRFLSHVMVVVVKLAPDGRMAKMEKLHDNSACYAYKVL